jgi:hypothetical protein
MSKVQKTLLGNYDCFDFVYKHGRKIRRTSCAKGEESPALDTKEICHTAPNSAMLQGLKPHAETGTSA